MPGTDPTHWLHRLSTEEWLRAAENELARARESLHRKQQRQGLAGARRAAGMAWNAVLVRAADDAWRDSFGRSYMEHLQTLARDASAPAAIHAAARSLLDAPLASDIVKLGPGDTTLADAAHTILEHARAIAIPRSTS